MSCVICGAPVDGANFKCSTCRITEAVESSRRANNYTPNPAPSNYMTPTEDLIGFLATLGCIGWVVYLLYFK